MMPTTLSIDPMPFAPKPHVYTKDHLKFFTVDELTAAYALFTSEVEARTRAQRAYQNPEGHLLLGDTFAALAAVSPATAQRVAQLLDEPLEKVIELREELLARLPQGRGRQASVDPRSQI
jgi:uncharacterized small protein (DUF1192 family)